MENFLFIVIEVTKYLNGYFQVRGMPVMGYAPKLHAKLKQRRLRLNSPAKKMHTHPGSHLIILSLNKERCNRINYVFGTYCRGIMKG
jgi:hypothetical protein